MSVNLLHTISKPKYRTYRDPFPTHGMLQLKHHQCEIEQIHTTISNVKYSSISGFSVYQEVQYNQLASS